MWKFFVKQQKIEIMEREVIADHQIAFVNLKFVFDNEWKKFHKVVQFTQCDETYNRVLGLDNTSCFLPSELHAGTVKMSVFGYDTETDKGIRATTAPVILNIRPSGFVSDGTEEIPPTPDLYTQLLQKLEEKASSLQNGINGKDGQNGFSPTIQMSQTSNGYDFTITDTDHTETGSLLNGQNGQNGLSAYEIAIENGYDGTVSEWLDSLKGEKGIKGDTGLQGEKGADGKDGINGLDGHSAYEIWLKLGNSGTEADFLNSLKGEKGETGSRGIQGERGEKGDTGERGLQGIQGDKGADGHNGSDGFSPTVEIAENTETSYKLLITDVNSSFTTPNLKGADGSSNGTGSIDVDDKFSETSENPVQNKVISSEISALWNQMSNLNDLISSIPSTGGNIRITTLFDNSNHTEYAENWNFKCSHWDNRIFSFDETAIKNSAFCNEENSYCIKFSNSFGWGADVTAVYSQPVQINSSSILIVNYSCTSDGDGITAELIRTSDFESEKITEFEIIPAFYLTNTFINAIFTLSSSPENGSYYLRFKVNTTNPAFTIKNISIINH